jgi:outer membrane protein OmpA-like peptidoglycan-associated protein
MDSLSVELLPGYHLGNFLLGLDFQLQWEGQLTQVANAGGTNLKGLAYYLGLGTQYTLNKRWAFQGAFSFLGRYSFNNQTDQGLDDHMGGPLGVRLKAQYHFSDTIPLSADFTFQYVHFSNVIVDSSSFSNAGSQWMAGLGITYRFRDNSSGSAQNGSPSPTPTATDTPVPPSSAVTPTSAPSASAEAGPINQEINKEDFQGIGEVKKTEQGVMVSLQGRTFKAGSADLSSESKEAIETIAKKLVTSPHLRIRVEGHSDTTGKPERNLSLSEARAKGVKAIFIEQGFSEEAVSAKGFGSAKPIADNGTPEGRERNRRVEIYIEKEVDPSGSEGKKQ